MPEDPRAASDARVAIAAFALIALITLVAVVLVAAKSAGGEAHPAPARCVDLWNSSTQALIDGYHNYHSHSYSQAEVLHLTRSGEPTRHGDCAVIFPSATLDPENSAAVKVYRTGRWMPLSKFNEVSSVRLSELQVEAIDGANVALRPDGTLEPTIAEVASNGNG